MRASVVAICCAGLLATVSADMAACMSAAREVMRCHMNGPTGFNGTWVPPTLGTTMEGSHAALATSSQCCSTDLMAACGSMEAMMTMMTSSSATKDMFSEANMRIMHSYAMSCPATAMDTAACSAKMTAMTTCLPSATKPTDCCPAWTGAGSACMRMKGMGMSMMMATIPMTMQSSANMVMTTCSDWTTMECKAATQRTAKCITMMGYDTMMSEPMNAGMCKEAMMMQMKMCDGYDATTQQSYAMTMGSTAANKTMMMQVYNFLYLAAMSEMEMDSGMCGMPVPEMYNMNGVVVSTMCPMPAMTPDASGMYPDHMCMAKVEAMVDGKPYFRVMDNLNMGQFVMSPMQSCSGAMGGMMMPNSSAMAMPNGMMMLPNGMMMNPMMMSMSGMSMPGMMADSSMMPSMATMMMMKNMMNSGMSMDKMMPMMNMMGGMGGMDMDKMMKMMPMMNMMGGMDMDMDMMMKMMPMMNMMGGMGGMDMDKMMNMMPMMMNMMTGSNTH